MALATRIIESVAPCDRTPAQVGREFRALLAGGARLRPAGGARARPVRLLEAGYTPKHRVRLFDASFYLANLREDRNFRFFVGYVVLSPEPAAAPRGLAIHPRIFYKDSSLVWRVATHYVRSATENWIGKGDVRWVREPDGEVLYTFEETCNLPFEIQAAFDAISRRGGRVRRDERAIPLVLRKSPVDRMEPYADFAAPRRAARAKAADRIHGGRPIAAFTRRGDPSSLRFVAGYEPDFARGLVDTSESTSRLYGGRILKRRILSRNRRIQYQFVSAPRQVWILPPQALTTELTSYGVRTLDVHAPEDLCVPGYEYHYIDEWAEPPSLYSQIPEGFAGAASEVDPSRADASPWIDAMPVIRAYRRAYASDFSSRRSTAR